MAYQIAGQNARWIRSNRYLSDCGQTSRHLRMADQITCQSGTNMIVLGPA